MSYANELLADVAVDIPEQDEIHRGVFQRLFGEPDVAPRARTLGRYRVRRCLGSGGMGTVYLAHDPQLERDVAIKVLHPELSKRAGNRLLAEAKAMARLTHPNVVGIYDIGEQDGQIFVAMEFVGGGTLREWGRLRRRSWQEVVAVYRAAARGLDAVHQAGIVHRDFKPDNVMVSADGCVKVTDFGIAREADALRERIASSIGPTRPDQEEDSVDGSVVARTVGGTPAYMAPEYVRGADTDVRSDQFSFSVSLYETLCGERPFDAVDILSLFAKIFSGERSERPALTQRVPAAIWTLIDRGLEVDPARRFKSMTEIEKVLASTLEPRRRRLAIPLACGAVLASAIGGAVVHGSLDRADCEDEGDRAEAVWEHHHDRVNEGMMSGSLPYAAQSWARVDERVSTWVDDWSDGRTRACMHRARDLHASRRASCFDALQDELSGVLTVLAEPSATTIEHAVAAVTELPEPSRCDDDAWLLAGIPEPPAPESREQVREAFQALSQAQALVRVLRADEAMPLVAEPIELAQTLDYAPLLSAARFTVASIQKAQGDYELAREGMVDALAEASRVDAPRYAAQAAVALIALDGVHGSRFERGHEWGRLSAGYLERLGDGGRELQRERLLHLSDVDWRAGDTQRALERAERALEDAVAEYGELDVRVPRFMSAVSSAHSGLSQWEQARDFQRRAVEINEQLLGPEHPMSGYRLYLMALTLWKEGRYRESEQAAEKAVEHARVALGPEHSTVAYMLDLQAISALYHGTGGNIAAPLLEEALRIKRLKLGPDHPSVIETKTHLGTEAIHVGDFDRALEYYRDCIESLTRTVGVQHIDYARFQMNIAFILNHQDKYAEAKAILEELIADVRMEGKDLGLGLYSLAQAERGLGQLGAAAGHAARSYEVLEDSLGPERSQTALALLLHGMLLLELGQLDEAEPRIIQGRDRIIAADLHVPEESEASFALARIRWAHGERAEAVALARQALETTEKNALFGDQAKEISRWLDDHRPRAGR